MNVVTRDPTTSQQIRWFGVLYFIIIIVSLYLPTIIDSLGMYS